MNRKAALIWLSILTLLFSACSAAQSTPEPTATQPPPTSTPLPTPTSEPPKAAPVEPVSGMPQGSAGFPWWNDTVFYEIFVRSFYDSDGDGTGDFNGITEKLDYLNDGDPSTTTDLGVTGIWLMPVFASPSYHGYDTTDYYSLNPEYGTLDDFKRMIDEAHRRGIRVIIDLMLNHTSNQHPWFQASRDPASPYRDWYIWSNTESKLPGPWGQDVWHPGPNNDYYYGVFWEGMPDLNFRNPEVVEEMLKVTRFWLEAGVDGYRLDGARYIVEEGTLMADTPQNYEFWQIFSQTVKETNPHAVTVGEVWTTSFVVAEYVEGNGLDLAFNFDMASAFVNSAKNGQASNAKAQIAITTKIFPPQAYAPFLTNHDIDRVMSQLDKDTNKAKVAAAMLLTAPGVPFIYYGEEVGMTGTKPDELIRRPMQWSAEDDGGFTTGEPWQALGTGYDQNNVTLAGQDPNSLLSIYTQLIELRRNHLALRVGEALKIDTQASSLYAILRHTGQESLLVLINLGEEPVQDFSLSLPEGPLQGTWLPVPLWGESDSPAAELAANAKGGFQDYQPQVTVPPYGMLIYQLHGK